MNEKNLTGYPSIDKPQEKFYRTIPIAEVDAEQTIYELIFNSNKDNMSSCALEYMGVTWSYEKLKKETDKAADAFRLSGLKLGDTVLIGVSNCPQTVVVMLALNKLGVVSKWFDVRAGKKDIEDYANDSDCRYIVIFDMLLPKIEMILDNTKLEKVLVIYPTDSLSLAVQTAYSLKAKHLPKDSRYIRFKDFVKDGNENAPVPCVEFDKNRPSIMIQSSGTTGKPKSIVHSDYSATSSAYMGVYLDTPLGRGKTILAAIPPWIAYDWGNAILSPLSYGSKVILCPTFEPNIIVNYLGKFTIAFAAPFNYRYIRDNFDTLTKKQKEGLSLIDCLVSGGDKISVEENQELENILGTVLVNGYGNNELWGCLTVNPVLHNKYGTVGIPMRMETVIAYDNENQKELPYGEIGEICALSNTTFLYYEGNNDATNSVKKLHPDGKVWLHTGDLGFIDEDGFITLCGRARRVIIRQGYKISAYTIEDKITEHPDVKECVAVEVKDKEEEHVPMAYIVLKEQVSENEQAIKESILEKCRSELKAYEIPKHIQFVPSLPYTQNGKYDFRLLEQQGNEFVDSQDNT